MLNTFLLSLRNGRMLIVWRGALLKKSIAISKLALKGEREDEDPWI
jgi:hypothetical protein